MVVWVMVAVMDMVPVMMVMLETMETVMMIMVKMTIKDLSLERLPLLVIVEDKSLDRVCSPLDQVNVPAVLELSGLGHNHYQQLIPTNITSITNITTHHQRHL